MKRAAKILAAGCFFVLAAAPITCYASVSWDTDSSVAGAAVVLNNYYASRLEPEETLAQTIASNKNFEMKVQTSPKAEVPTVTSTQSAYSNVAISHVSNYVNVRTEANTDSDIVGKIYNNCAATILATVDGEGGKWYQIQSGTVKGYIKAEYFITGTEAEKIAKKVGTMYAKVVNTSTLRLREEPNTTSTTLTLLSMDAEYVALEETGDFVKIQVDADLLGYVHKDYVNIRVEFKQAVSVEEERQQQEEADRLKREADEAIARMNQVKQEAEANESTSGAGASSQPSNTTAASTSVAASTTASANISETTAEGTTVPETAAASTEPIGTIAASPLEPTKAAESTAAPTRAPETTAKQTSKAAETTAKQTTSAEQYGPGGGSGGPGWSGSSGGGPGSAEVTSATRTAIVAYAKQFLGNPYVYGGTSLTNGADCSGFTMRIYEHFGIDTGRTSRDQADNGREISLDAIQPGDLLFYASGDYINHVAMYVGGGQVIHASSSTTGIIYSPAYYRTPYKAVTFLD